MFRRQVNKNIMAQRLDPAFVKAQFELAGYEMLGEYVKRSLPIKFRCDQNHVHQMTICSLKRGIKCAYCAGSIVTQEQVKQAFDEKKFTLLSEYKSSNGKLDFICSMGHKHQTTWNDMVKGVGCAYCSKKKIDPETVKEAFVKNNYILHSIYQKNHGKLKYTCNRGHAGVITWSNFKKGHRCPACAGQVITHRKVEQAFRDEGYTLLSEYKKSGEKLNFICPMKHSHSISWASFRRGSRCGLCFAEKSYASMLREKALRKIVKSIRADCKSRKTSEIKNDNEVIQVARSIEELYKNCPKGHHVDHIVPVSYFCLNNRKEIKACWNINNLRYLPVIENLSRCNKMRQEEVIFMKNNYPGIFYTASRNPHLIPMSANNDKVLGLGREKQLELELCL